jgi:hypothetical protein
MGEGRLQRVPVALQIQHVHASRGEEEAGTMNGVHMALTGNAGAVHAVATAVAGRYPTAERQVPRAPGMLHTKIYSVDVTEPGTDEKPSGLAPAGAGEVQIKLSGDVDGAERLARWIARVFQSDDVKVGPDGRVSLEVRPDQAPPNTAPGR